MEEALIERAGMEVVTAEYQHRSLPGLSSAALHGVVVAFYAKVRRDPLLGPVFDQIIGDEWDAHLEKVCAFWRYATRIDRSYNSRDFIPAHLKHPQIRASLLPRWIVLFRQTARELCPDEVAEHLIDIAERMAASIEISLTRRESADVPERVR